VVSEDDILEQNLSKIIDRAAWHGIPECPDCGHKLERTKNKRYCLNADCDKEEVRSP